MHQNEIPHFKRNLKNILFTAFFIASTLTLCGQSKKIVVFIDTLHITPGGQFHLNTARTVVEYDSPFVWVGKRIDSIPNNYDAKEDSIFVTTVEIINDSTDLRIPMDNEGGFLEILNLYGQPFDTIRISKWKVFSNCYPDTFLFSRSYYKRNPDDTLPNLFKHEEKLTITHKKCHNSTAKTICFMLNNVNYSLPTTMTLGNNLVTLSHGYNKDIYKLKNLNPKRKLIYKATCRETKKHIDKATIRL